MGHLQNMILKAGRQVHPRRTPPATREVFGIVPPGLEIPLQPSLELPWSSPQSIPPLIFLGGLNPP